MPGGGVIFAAILVGWALFLLPQWLRRDSEVHLDLAANPQITKSASDRLQPLEELSMPSDLTELDSDTAGSESADFPSAERDAPSGVRERAHVLVGRLSRRSSTEQRAPLTAAARRRRVLAVLMLAVLVTGALAASAVVALWAPVVAGLLLAGYLVLLAVAGRRRAAALAVDFAADGHFVASDDGSHADEQLTGPIQVVARTASGDATLLAVAEVAAVVPAPAVASASSFDSSSWAPVQVPLPTYVTKPKARRTIRSIDLSGPGSWTSGRLAPAEAEAYAAAFAQEHAVTPEIVDAQPADDRDAHVARRVVGE